MRKKIIIDTDPGCDDALALILAIKSNAFDIKAITTVCGNTSIVHTTSNAQYILNALEIKNIPLYSGASKPLKRALESDFFFEKDGMGGIIPETMAVLTANAVEKIIELIEENPFEITLVALGPLTNIAQAIIKNEQAMNKVHELIIVGGAFNVPGNISPVADFNIFVDPEAADVVFKSTIKKTLIPLDACIDMQLNWNELLTYSSGLFKRLIQEMMQNAHFQMSFPCDTLAIYYLNHKNVKVDKSYVSYNSYISIETKAPLMRGETIAHKNAYSMDMQPVQIIERISSTLFREYLRSVLSKSFPENTKP